MANQYSLYLCAENMLCICKIKKINHKTRNAIFRQADATVGNPGKYMESKGNRGSVEIKMK